MFPTVPAAAPTFPAISSTRGNARGRRIVLRQRFDPDGDAFAHTAGAFRVSSWFAWPNGGIAKISNRRRDCNEAKYEQNHTDKTRDVMLSATRPRLGSGHGEKKKPARTAKSPVSSARPINQKTISRKTSHKIRDAP
jgi:hypothetical protein